MKCPYRLIRIEYPKVVLTVYCSPAQLEKHRAAKKKITSNVPCPGTLLANVTVTHTDDYGYGYNIGRIDVEWLCYHSSATHRHKVPTADFPNAPFNAATLDDWINKRLEKESKIETSNEAKSFWQHVKV